MSAAAEQRGRTVFGVPARPGDWPLTIKVTALCVGIAMTVAVSVAFIGYVEASRGLQEQSGARLESDARIVASNVDRWSAERLNVVHSLAKRPSVARALEAGSPRIGQAANDVQEDLSGLQAGIAGVDSLSILDANGVMAYSTNTSIIGSSYANRDHYQHSIKGENFVSGVSASMTDNSLSLFASAPIRTVDGRIVGVANAKSNPDALQKLVESEHQRIGGDARGVLLDEQGLVIASSADPSSRLRPIVSLKPDVADAMLKDKRWGKDGMPEPLGEADLAPVLGIETPRHLNWGTQGTELRAAAVPLSQTHWTYVAALPSSTFNAAAVNLLRVSVFAAAAVLLLASLVTVLFARPIARAVRQVAEAAKGLAAGDLDQRIEVRSRDEVGQMARAFEAMIAYQQEMAGVARAVAEGDLSGEVQPKSERDVLGTAFQRMTGSLQELVGQVQSASVQLAAASSALGGHTGETGMAANRVAVGMQRAAEGFQTTRQDAHATSEAVLQLNQAIDGIARGAADQARQVQTTSATATQMASGVEQVAANAHQVAAASQQARVAAEHGAQAVQETVDGMAQIQQVVGDAAGRVQDLGKLGQKIGAVVETIDDIAGQTNLLALNAAIEAARAGEHGKGFAVVADEVRKLAERSSRETKQIAELIQQVQQGTRDAVTAMESGASKVEQGAGKADEAGRALVAILEAVDGMVGQVTDIASAAQQMAAGARNVVDAMQSISAVVEENSAATEEMTAQAGQVRNAVEGIARVAETQSADIQDMSAGTQEMNVQIEGMGAQVQELAAMAERLNELVARFTVHTAVRDAENVVPFHRAA